MVKGFRRLVKYEDLNPAKRLFGGRLLEWIDEAAALYVSCQLNTQNIVTVSISEGQFKVPVKLGDFLEFHCDTVKMGTSSITVSVDVYKKVFHDGGIVIPEGVVKPSTQSQELVFKIELVFVRINPDTGKATPHGMTMKVANESN